MKREGHIVKVKVPPGANNPLGKYWIGLSLSAIGIHGTIAPSSVYHFQSHGCIRLHPDDIAQLFEKTPISTTVNIVYIPILLTESTEKIFLEVNPDVYHKNSNSIAVIERLAHDRNMFDRIDWLKVSHVFELKEGIASDVSLTINQH